MTWLSGWLINELLYQLIRQIIDYLADWMVGSMIDNFIRVTWRGSSNLIKCAQQVTGAADVIRVGWVGVWPESWLGRGNPLCCQALSIVMHVINVGWRGSALLRPAPGLSRAAHKMINWLIICSTNWLSNELTNDLITPSFDWRKCGLAH